MCKKAYRTMIKRHFKKGTFQVFRQPLNLIHATATQYKKMEGYYVEKQENGLLLLNLKSNTMTIYIQK